MISGMPSVYSIRKVTETPTHITRCGDVYEHGVKRCLLVSPQVSTARLDTREVTTPDYVPGTADALLWANKLLGCSTDELAATAARHLR